MEIRRKRSQEPKLRLQEDVRAAHATTRHVVLRTLGVFYRILDYLA